MSRGLCRRVAAHDRWSCWSGAVTIVSEVANNGGRRRYRALKADRSRGGGLGVPSRRSWRSARGCGPRSKRGWRSCGHRKRSASSLRADHPGDPEIRVSHETIYMSLFVQGRGALRKELTACLRSGRAMRRPRHVKGGFLGQLTNMVMISERPAVINDRAVPGHWEGDLIFGRRMTAIGTLVERWSRYVMLVALPDGHTAEAVHVARWPPRSPPCPTPYGNRSPGTKAKKWPTTFGSASTPACTSTSVTQKPVATRLQREHQRTTPPIPPAPPTSPPSPNTNSTRSPPHSTDALDKHSTG